MARDGRTKDYDPYLLEKIQPQGGITFREPAMIETGTGYETCLHIYDYPNSLDDYWMAKICNIKNAVTVIDMATNDKNKIKKKYQSFDERTEISCARREKLFRLTRFPIAISRAAESV